MSKQLVCLLCSFLLVAFSFGLTNAADIEWGDAFEIETVDDIDVSNQIVAAMNLAPDDSDIVEVEFAGNVFVEFELAQPFGSISANADYYTQGGLTTGSDELDYVFDSHGWQSTGAYGDAAELILEDLEVGTAYQIQLIGAADDRDCCEYRQVQLVDIDFDPIRDDLWFGRSNDFDQDGERGPGSVIGTFTADDEIQEIFIIGVDDFDDGDGNFGSGTDPGMSAYVLSIAGGDAATMLEAGDANQDLEFNQLDLVQVQIAAKYLTGDPATWGEGDWDGAPGGEVGSPPQGDGVFSQLDIIAALNGGWYLQGPYGAIVQGGTIGDGQTSIVYDAGTGEVSVDAPAGTDLTSVNIDSAAAIFTGDPAENLGGSFDNDADNNIFKATFGGSFGSLSFGNVAQAGLSEEFVAGDLTVVGSLNGGGDLGAVDLVYIPEPSSLVLLSLALAGAAMVRVRRRV